MKVLNSRQVKKILQLIKEQYGCDFPKDYVFLQREDDIFIINKDLAKIDLDKLKLNSLGLYIAEIRHGELRLGIEGAQIAGPKATKNVVEVTPDQEKQWFLGNDIETDTDAEGFVILKSGDDFLGSGKVKQGRILNYMPKIRRLNTVA